MIADENGAILIANANCFVNRDGNKPKYMNFHHFMVCNHNEDWQIEKRKYHEDRIRHLESLGHNVKIIWDHEFDPSKEVDIDR